MKSHVLLTVWCNICNISGGAGGEIWHWSLSGVKGLKSISLLIDDFDAQVDSNGWKVFLATFPRVHQPLENSTFTAIVHTNREIVQNSHNEFCLETNSRHALEDNVDAALIQHSRTDNAQTPRDRMFYQFSDQNKSRWFGLARFEKQNMKIFDFFLYIWKTFRD